MRKPGVSIRNSRGSPNASHNEMKWPAFSQTPAVIEPAMWSGWLATTPTGRPSRRARLVMIDLACVGRSSNTEPTSTTASTTLRMSYALARVGRHDREQVFRLAVRRVGRLLAGHRQRRVRREVGKEPPDRGERFVLGVDDEVDDPALGLLVGSAELLLGEVGAHRRLHEGRAGHADRADASDHHHEVGEGREVGGTGEPGSVHRGDDRHPSRHARQLSHVAARVRRGELTRVEPLLDAVPAAVVEDDERMPALEAQLRAPAHLQGSHRAAGAADGREVVRGRADEPAVDGAVTRDETFARVATTVGQLRDLRCRERSDLAKGSRVEEARHSLARGELAETVLARD